jgi:plasmid stabilization system protein ParE
LKRLEIVKEAEAELRDAVTWYRERDPRVAERFSDAARETLRLIEGFPEVGSYVPGVHDRDVRRMPIHGFPYHVVFVRFADHLQVVAFAHRRRSPVTSRIACLDADGPSSIASHSFLLRIGDQQVEPLRLL